MVSFIAEFWNTLTNIVIFAAGIYGAWRGVRLGLDRRIIVAYLSLALIGFGSALFHGTLRYDAQLADELPMLWSGCVFVYATSPKSWRHTPELRSLLIVGLVCAVTVVSVLYVETRHVLIHEGVFLAGAIVVFRRCLQWSRRLSKEPRTVRMRSVLYWGAVFGWGAFLIWNVDNTICDHLRRWRKVTGPVLGVVLNGHALWHIGTGLAGGALAIFTTTYDEWIPDPETGLMPKPEHGIEYTWFGLPITVRLDQRKGSKE